MPSAQPYPQMRKTAAIGRLIVLIIVLVTLVLVALDALISKYLDGNPFDVEPLVFRLGPWSLEVVDRFPPLDFLIFTLIGITAVALGSVALEIAASLRQRNPAYRELGIDVSPISGTPLRVTVLVPAHNEATNLPITLPALSRQSRRPDRVIVVADNCQDDTEDVALSLGAEVFVTRDNTHRKAGALNQALRALRDSFTVNDVILVMDADTSLSPDFIRVAESHFQVYPALHAIGGLFYGEPGHGIIGQLQRNEYVRYQLQIRHRRGRVFVLTGTASAFRAEVLMAVSEARGSLLPGVRGDVYDTAAITEDNEITIALKSLGFTMISPQECNVETELMPDWKALWVQRKRWQRGALDNLAEYGFTSATARYWGQQIGIAYGTVALFTAYIFLVLSLLAMDRFYFYTFWIVVTAIFVIERTVTVWAGGWRARLVAAPLVIEVAYSFFLQANFLSSMYDLLRRKAQRWGHLRQEGLVDTS